MTFHCKMELKWFGKAKKDNYDFLFKRSSIKMMKLYSESDFNILEN